MPGLLSAFFTGTPMAPLPGIGLIYCGFLMMHLRRAPLTGLDVTRVAQLLATLHVLVCCV